MEDEAIIGLYIKREEQAIVETSNKYGAYCRGIAHNILNNSEDTEECLSDTWLHTWNAIPPQKPKFLAAFVGRITRNLSLDRYRANKAKKRGGGEMALVLHELEECLSTEDAMKRMEEGKEIREALTRFLQELSIEERLIFMRRYWYVDSIKEIAFMAAMTESKVTSMLFRLRKKLKQYFEKEGIWI